MCWKKLWHKFGFTWYYITTSHSVSLFAGCKANFGLLLPDNFSSRKHVDHITDILRCLDYEVHLNRTGVTVLCIGIYYDCLSQIFWKTGIVFKHNFTPNVNTFNSSFWIFCWCILSVFQSIVIRFLSYCPALGVRVRNSVGVSMCAAGTRR